MIKKGGCGWRVTYKKILVAYKQPMSKLYHENLIPPNTWLPACAGAASDRPVRVAPVQEENRGAVRM